jgi:hypothetical protein
VLEFQVLHQHAVQFLSDQKWNALKKLGSEINQSLEHPGEKEKKGYCHGNQFRDEIQTRFLNLGGSLKNTYQKTYNQTEKKRRSRDNQSQYYCLFS